MSDHALEWSPEPRNVQPEIAAAVDAVESRLEVVGYDGYGAPIYVHQLPPVVKFLPAPVSIINARDCELAGFNLADVLEAAKKSAP